MSCALIDQFQKKENRNVCEENLEKETPWFKVNGRGGPGGHSVLPRRITQHSFLSDSVECWEDTVSAHETQISRH